MKAEFLANKRDVYDAAIDLLLNAPTPDIAALFRMFERGVRNIPDAAPLRNIYGFFLLREGRYDQALAQFDEYIRLAPNEPNSYDSMFLSNISPYAIAPGPRPGARNDPASE